MPVIARKFVANAKILERNSIVNFLRIGHFHFRPFHPMKKKCPNCGLVSFASVEVCGRCGSDLHAIEGFSPPVRSDPTSMNRVFLRRVLICLFAIVFTVGGFYISLVGSASPLSFDQKQTVNRAIRVLDRAGFSSEVRLLDYFTAYRSTDNWLNASVEKENAYAATNFPFEIMTIYPEFFDTPIDDVERAAILLHEAQHLKGANEHDAYRFVWKNRDKIGWTREAYGDSIVWRNVRKQTREAVPELFNCDEKEFADCTE